MSPAPELRVGVVGYSVMGKAHCFAYRVGGNPHPVGLNGGSGPRNMTS